MKNDEFMTIGELAKKMDTTIRTLQYYDREGILHPSAKSEGGRRLYTNKDRVKLHQIFSMKFLGFSLEDIKNRLVSLDTPQEVLNVLGQQEIIIKEKISSLSEALTIIKGLQKEIELINEIDFSKYAHMIELLLLKDNNYWALKFFEDKTVSNFQGDFTEQAANSVKEEWQRLSDEITVLIQEGETPDGTRGQKIASEWWNMVMEFTGGDITMLQILLDFNDKKENWKESFKEKQLIVDDFISNALSIYLKNQNIEWPIMEVDENKS